MPTYEYACDACGARFERFETITASPSRICDRCGKARAKRLIGAGAGLIFRGSGFYITDYRSESYRKAAAAETGSAKSEDRPAGDGARGEPGAGKAGKSGRKEAARSK